MTQRSDELPAGYVLDRYSIECTLGDGGFGITYLGKHAAGWKVAIKELLPSEYAFREGGDTKNGNANVIARGGSYAENFQIMKESFLREARILAKFAEHPNIVTVKDFFEANGTAYLVMQYEEGQTLEQWLEKNTSPTQEQLLHIFIPVLDGLRAVHAANYLHRDIKPGNIYIRSDGRPFILDFGSTREVIADKKTMVLTDGYSPFEQYSTNGNQGAWSDIYATGATLWTCINGGQTPASAMNRANARMDGSPDPYQPASIVAKSRYTNEFLAAIDWALAFVIKDRPQTVREWQDTLLGFLQVQEKPQQPEPTKVSPQPKQSAVVLPETIHKPIIKPQDNRPADALPRGYKLANYGIGNFVKATSYGYLYEATFDATRNVFTPSDYLILEIRSKHTWEYDFYKRRATLFCNAQHQQWEKVWGYFTGRDKKQYIVLGRDEQISITEWQSLHQVASERVLFDQIVNSLVYGIKKINKKEKILIILDESDLFFTATKDGFSNIKIRLTAGLKVRGYDARGVSQILVGDFAPESFDEKNRGEWTVVYFLGTVLYFLVKGCWPENYSNRVQGLLDQGKDLYLPLSGSGISRYSKAFLEAIDWALKTNHRERPQTIDQFHNALLGKTKLVLPRSPNASQPSSQLYPPGIQFHDNKQSKTNYKVQMDPVSSPEPKPSSQSKTRIIRVLEPEMVHIPAGKFMMGCIESKKGWLGTKAGRDDVAGGCHDDEKPAHEVSLSTFSIGKYPITFVQFDCFCEATGFPKPSDNSWGRGNRPVINVSWNDTQTYIRWLNHVTGKNYRLSTEAEWEYAARAGSNTAYPWGMKADPIYANYGWSIGKTTPVGQYPANVFGLHDMHGNVWEWCGDWFGNYTVSPVSNPMGASSGTLRVLRGGSWSSYALFARSAHRYSLTPDIRIYDFGFRLVLP
jgi:formylglycine-generating enzyme required for sulfatase activity